MHELLVHPHDTHDRLPELEDPLSSALPAYEIGPMIGRGTFGVVYFARHTALGRNVAIKRLWPDLTLDLRARRRFATEGCLLAALDHPHIVRVYDYVDGFACALVLEYAGGGTLHDRLANGTVSSKSAVAIAQQALAGLEHAHRRGLVHRDVKPSNLLFTEDGSVKLADFGLAEAIDPEPEETTLAHAAGTPAFMAPEQIAQALGPISPATDVWAVGAILYEMLAGAPTARDKDISSMLLRRITTDHPPLSRVVASVSDALSNVVATAMARTPGRRFQTAGEFAAELSELVLAE
jgi:serine/threonine-protein kinase